MNLYHQKLIPDNSYHLFSRAIGNEKLFLSSDNYLYFLDKLKQHTDSVCKIYSYSLLPNHFHLLAKIDDEHSIVKHFEAIKRKDFNSLTDDLSDFIMERFSNLLNSYTKSFNKRENRKGALFMDYMKRSIVNTDSDFTSFLWYVHKNAVHHGLTKNVGDWKYDSCQSLLSNAPTNLLRQEVLQWFGNKEKFIAFHQQIIYSKIEFTDL